MFGNMISNDIKSTRFFTWCFLFSLCESHPNPVHVHASVCIATLEQNLPLALDARKMVVGFGPRGCGSR